MELLIGLFGFVLLARYWWQDYGKPAADRRKYERWSRERKAQVAKEDAERKALFEAKLSLIHTKFGQHWTIESLPPDLFARFYGAIGWIPLEPLTRATHLFNDDGSPLEFLQLLESYLSQEPSA